MKQKTGRKLLSFLLTLAMVVGLMPGMGLTAYAADATESITTATNNKLIYTGSHFKVQGTGVDNDGLYIFVHHNGSGQVTKTDTVTISSLNGETIKKIEGNVGYQNRTQNFNLKTTKGNISISGNTLTVNNVNAVSVTISNENTNTALLQVKSWKIYYESSEVAVTGVTLNSATASIKVGDTKALTATVQPANATNKNVTWSSNNTGVATVSNTGVVTGVSEGTASITVTTADGNKTASCAVTVSKKDNPLTYAATQSVNKTFSASAQTETLAEATDGQGDVSYTINSQKDSKNAEVNYFTLDGTTLTLAASTPAGTYTVVVCASAAGNDNYKNGTSDSTVTVTINKAGAAVNAPTAKTLTYTGSAQEFITAGSATGGEMQYALGTASEATQPYTTSIPTETNVGTYYVWYKVVGDENHNDTEPECMPCNIQKKTLTVTAIDKSKTYGKDDPELDYTVEGLVGDDELTGTLTRAEGQEVGTYAITQGTLSAGDNYSIEFTGADFIITRIPLEITVSTYNGIYDGKAHSITVDVGASDAVVYYGTEELTADNYETAGSTENPTYTDAGEYTVYFYIVSSRYEADPISGSKAVTIRKAEPVTSIETEVNTSDDAPVIKVDHLDHELAAKLLTEEETAEYENGTPVLVYLDVTVLDKANVPAADLTAVETVMNANGYTDGECLDLSLWKKLGDGTPVQIHDTNGNAIKVTVTIPDAMKNVPTGYVRTYQIIRVHDGVATVMAEGTGATLEISSDKFSSYFLVYKDTKVESETTTEATDAASTSDATTASTATEAAKTSPKTGDSMPIAVLIVWMLSMAGALVFLDLKKNQE